jgi:hypothetical protein
VARNDPVPLWTFDMSDLLLVLYLDLSEEELRLSSTSLSRPGLSKAGLHVIYN